MAKKKWRTPIGVEQDFIEIETPSVIEPVVLEEIRSVDGAQKYRHEPTGNNQFGVTWLCGWNRAANVKVGDVGRLVYKATPTSGLWWFGKSDIPEKD